MFACDHNEHFLLAANQATLVTGIGLPLDKSRTVKNVGRCQKMFHQKKNGLDLLWKEGRTKISSPQMFSEHSIKKATEERSEIHLAPH